MIVTKRCRVKFFFSANFCFSRGARVAEVAYDPQLPYLFYGEEALMGVRCYTHGWDAYTPTRAWAFHLWEKGHRPSYDAELSPRARSLLKGSRHRLAQPPCERRRRVARQQPGRGPCSAHGLVVAGGLWVLGVDARGEVLRLGLG